MIHDQLLKSARTLTTGWFIVTLHAPDPEQLNDQN